jgi:hypothetical protein
MRPCIQGNLIQCKSCPLESRLQGLFPAVLPDEGSRFVWALHGGLCSEVGFVMKGGGELLFCDVVE